MYLSERTLRDLDRPVRLVELAAPGLVAGTCRLRCSLEAGPRDQGFRVRLWLPA